MTQYKGIYLGKTNGSLTHGKEYELILAENNNGIFMRVKSRLHIKTQHLNIESLLNTWGMLVPIKINNTKTDYQSEFFNNK